MNDIIAYAGIMFILSLVVHAINNDRLDNISKAGVPCNEAMRDAERDYQISRVLSWVTGGALAITLLVKLVVILFVRITGG